MNILVKVRMRAAHQPLKERLHALDTNFYLWPEIPGERFACAVPVQPDGHLMLPGGKLKLMFWLAYPSTSALSPKKPEIEDRRSASPVQVGRREVVHRHVMHIRIVGRQFSKVLTQCGFSRIPAEPTQQEAFFS